MPDQQTSQKPDYVAPLAIGGFLVLAAGIAAVALLSVPKQEAPDELVSRLVENALRRGDKARPWYEMAGGEP